MCDRIRKFMNKTQKFCVDTNFFITLYSADPSKFIEDQKLFLKLGIEFVISSYVQREMRWYMRRIIEKEVKVVNVKENELSKYENALKKRLKSLPQTPDVSVIYVAQKLGIGIVSSDLKLIETAEAINLRSYMNSSFLVYLLQKDIDEQTQRKLEELHDKLFADEVGYSVKGQHVYDPVIRIKKIMDSALDVVRKNESLHQSAETPVNYNYPEYLELKQITKEIRTDLSDYLDLLEIGDYISLQEILKEKHFTLLDRATEVHLLDVSEKDKVYQEAMITLGHILLLEVSNDLALQDIDSMESNLNLLNLLAMEIEEIGQRLEIDLHLFRIVVFILTEQFKRLNIYFTTTFMERCRKSNREDIVDLIRTFGIVSAVLSNNKAEETATAKDFSEIEFIIQLGFQFAAIKKAKKSWLLLEQALYMSLNSKMHGLIYATFEVLLPLNYATGGFSPTIDELIRLVQKKSPELPLDVYEKRLALIQNIEPSQLIKRQKDISALPSNFQGYLDVLSVELSSFKQIGSCHFVKVIEWESMNIVGLIDPSLSIPMNSTVGTSIKIISGKVKLIQPPKKLSEAKGVSLILVCYPNDLKFLLRKAGNYSVTRSNQKISDYDL